MTSSSLSITLSSVAVLIAMAFYTLLERKFMSYSQTRKGPNKPSLLGIPQPLADAAKLFTKQMNIPMHSNMMIFAISPILSLMLAMTMWSLSPHLSNHSWFTWSVMMFLCVSSLTVYPTMLAGWSSNSKYSLLGAMRGVAQTISYEVTMSLIMISILLTMSSLEIQQVLTWSMYPPMLLIIHMGMLWLVVILAETNRTPFDFAEGESELVSGFNTEFSGGFFAFIFMAEYMSMMFMATVSSCILLLSFKNLLLNNIMMITTTFYLMVLFIWSRSTLPRMRYDWLMMTTWLSLLPISLLSTTLLTNSMMLA